MPTQFQYNVSKQVIRNQTIRIDLLNLELQKIGEFSGNCIGGDITIDSNSSIRRTCNIELVATDSSFDIQSGSKIWLDKLIQVYVGIDSLQTGETIWNNYGIYMVNSPTWKYDAITNNISFTGLDLMAKMTGDRNGYLEGIPTTIPQGSSVRESMITTVTQLGGFKKYIIDDCKLSDGTIQEVPYDIEIDQGGTVYDILEELKNIMPYYEIFFDIDGVFVYQQIPTGKNEVVIADNDVFDQNVISEEIFTDFGGVKNVIEVYGATHDIEHYSSSTTLDDNVVKLTISSITDITEYTMVGFTLPSDVSGELQINLNSTGKKDLVSSNGENITSLDADVYYVAMYQENATWLFLGGLQAYALWKEENQESPFYIGSSIGEIRTVKYGGEYENIQSDELAMERAIYEGYLACQLNDNINLNCVPIHWLDVNKLISYTTKNNTIPSQYLIKSINVGLGTGATQTLNCMRFYPTYYPPTTKEILLEWIEFLDTFAWGILPDSYDTQDKVLAKVQDMVDNLIPDNIVNSIEVLDYASNATNVGNMDFKVTLTLDGISETTSSLVIIVQENQDYVAITQATSLIEHYNYPMYPSTVVTKSTAYSKTVILVNSIITAFNTQSGYDVSVTINSMAFSDNKGQSGLYAFTVDVSSGELSNTTEMQTITIEEAPYNVEILASIGSTGTQWIDTGYTPSTTKTNIDFTFDGISTNNPFMCLYGARGTSANKDQFSTYIGVNRAYIRPDFGNLYSQQKPFYSGELNFLTANSKITINGHEYTAQTTDNRTPKTIYIFAENNITAGYLSTCKFVGENTISEAGYTMHKYVGVRLLETNEVCLYDYVTKTLLRNQGTGSLVGYSKATPEYANLVIFDEAPEAELLECIETNGANYVDTGYKPSITATSVQAVLQVENQSTYNGLIGARPIDAIDNNGNGLFMAPNNTVILLTTGENVRVAVSESPIEYTWNKDRTTINADQYPRTGTLTGQINYSMYIGALNTGGVADRPCPQKIYTVTISENNVIIRDYVPVRRISDGLVTMYDRVNGTYLTPLGTGVFVATPYSEPRYIM